MNIEPTLDQAAITLLVSRRPQGLSVLLHNKCRAYAQSETSRMLQLRIPSAGRFPQGQNVVRALYAETRGNRFPPKET